MGLRELWSVEERERVEEGARRFLGGLDRMQRAAGGGPLGTLDDVLTQLIWEMWPVLNVQLSRATGSPPLARVSTLDGGYADAVRTVLNADPALAEAYAGNTLPYPGALPTALPLPIQGRRGPLYPDCGESPRTLKLTSELGKTEDLSLEGVVDKLAEKLAGLFSGADAAAPTEDFPG